MKTGKERRDYWNHKYYEYWKSRVAEAGRGATSQVVAGDPNTEDDSVYERIFAEHPFRPGSLLEVGCAWGRMFPIYKRAGLEISGADISAAMIAAAREAYGQDAQIRALLESEAESLPFPDESFDNLACLATFDATFQPQALAEFLRVIKPGGRLYLTGKNARYFADDQKALEAEAGARSKGHPNFFTDVPRMLKMIDANGHRVVAAYYFPRRGDFGRHHHLRELPDRFYEWLLVIERTGSGREFGDFADERSETSRLASRT